MSFHYLPAPTNIIITCRINWWPNLFFNFDHVYVLYCQKIGTNCQKAKSHPIFYPREPPILQFSVIFVLVRRIDYFIDMDWFERNVKKDNFLGCFPVRSETPQSRNLDFRGFFRKECDNSNLNGLYWILIDGYDRKKSNFELSEEIRPFSMMKWIVSVQRIKAPQIVIFLLEFRHFFIRKNWIF